MWCIKAPFEAVNIITLPSFNKHRAENAKYLYKQSALQKLPWEKHNPQSTFKMFSEINVVLIQMSLWDILYNNLLIYRIAPNLLSWPAVIWKIRLLIMLNVTLVLKLYMWQELFSVRCVLFLLIVFFVFLCNNMENADSLAVYSLDLINNISWIIHWNALKISSCFP